MDTTAVLNQTVMTREVLDMLPDTNNVWSIGRLVPAVIQNNIDVGGTGAFQQSTTSVHGSRGGSETNYLIDGMNIGSVSGDGGIQIYYDPFMFEQLAYQTGGVSAETSRGGFVYNMVTHDGHEQASRLFHRSTAQMRGCNSTTSLLSCGRSCCAACRHWRWRQIRTSNPGRRSSGCTTSGLTVTGPIVSRQIVVRRHDEADVPRPVARRQLQPGRNAVRRRQQDGDLFGQAVVCDEHEQPAALHLPVLQQAAVSSQRQQPDRLLGERRARTCRSSKGT